MSKKNKNNKINSYSSDSDEMIRMLKVLGIVVVALGLFYLVFAIASGEISFGKKDTKVQEEIQNVEILAGTTFNRMDLEYYVMFYDFEATSSVSYAALYDLYLNTGNKNMYLVDLNKNFNKGYIVEDKTLIDISSIDSLKVVNGTMIKVENGKGVSYAVGTDEIKDILFKEEQN